MSDPRFIFDTVDYQNGANTVNNYVTLYNAQNNAAVTGNGFKFKSDADRMKNLLGSNGQTRNSGYYEGLYATFYNLLFRDNVTVPSINGPGNPGWGAQLSTGPILNLLNLTDSVLQARAKQSDYVAIQISGYLYSPVATTVVFQVTSDDGVAIYLNGINTSFTPVSPDAWGYHGPITYTSGTLTVNAGYNPITIRYFEGGGGSQLTFAYRLGSQGYQTRFGSNFFYNFAQM